MRNNKMIGHKGSMLLLGLLLFSSCVMRAEDAGLDVVIQYPTLTSTVYHRLETDECTAGMFSLMSAIDIIANGTPLVNIFQTSMNSSYMIVSRWGKDPLQEK